MKSVRESRATIATAAFFLSLSLRPQPMTLEQKCFFLFFSKQEIVLKTQP